MNFPSLLKRRRKGGCLLLLGLGAAEEEEVALALEARRKVEWQGVASLGRGDCWNLFVLEISLHILLTTPEPLLNPILPILLPSLLFLSLALFFPHTFRPSLFRNYLFSHIPSLILLPSLPIFLILFSSC